ncbi:MAG: homoserine kinase [Sporomusaceae bacterium]|jgi:homoserine kinase|nr:homoserine kinase [Sporomusaceae bacterium]
MKSVKVRVPGTTANCGPGFDTIGIALSVYNELELSLLPEKGLEIIIAGTGAAVLPRDEKNIVLEAIGLLFDRLAKEFHYSPRADLPGLRLKMDNQIPLARGLGSSAAAIVAALVAANAISGAKFSQEDILAMATQMEGHPDNVAPAIYGGVTLSITAETSGERVRCLKFLPAAKFSLVVAVPEFELATKLSREALPNVVPLRDAVFNISRAALLTGALALGKLEYLKEALDDKLHQPYRQKLITGMSDVFKAATDNGALGAVLSGSGPCLIAFTESNEDAIGSAMVDAFGKHNVQAKYLNLAIDAQGAQVI